MDEMVRVDTNGPNTLVSSRKPADLVSFNAELLAVFASTQRRSSAMCAIPVGIAFVLPRVGPLRP